MRTHLARNSGMSLFEVLVAAGILAIVSASAVFFLLTEWRQDALDRDREFAMDRAQSILEELRAFAEVGETNDAATLDQFDDGITFSNTLSTLHKPVPFGAQLVDPDAPISGNMRTSDGTWRYARRITVRHFPGVDQRDLRIVTVRVFLSAGATTGTGPEIANVSSAIRTVSEPVPPTQVYDVYFVALENVPGWWVYMDTIRPFVEASLSDLVGRNPGLKFRTHWITKLGYGRNPQYTPFFNEAAASTSPIPYAYFYPGKMPTASASQRYYVPDNVQGRANVDGLIRNGWDATTNPFPYTLADQHNSCMRLPEEEALFDARVSAGQEDAAAPTWRLLLERMNSQPDAYRNAIIVNLHGELLPLPPLRNYSDAAREPESRPGVRVVTHPEKIRFARGAASEDVQFRVYTYRTIPGVLPEQMNAPVIVEIPGMDLTGNVNLTGAGPLTLGIGRVTGGLDLNPVNGARDPYALDTAPVVMGAAKRTPAYAGEMYARVYWAPTAYSGNGATVIELHNSPLSTVRVSNQGLDPTKRLYGMDYIPCPTEATNDFTTNLASNLVVEKNTARWTIRIPATMLGSADRRIEAVTRIGHGNAVNTGIDNAAFATGIMYPPAARTEPENISKTYCWWAASPEAVPFTERYQYQGDPRHCPYADLRVGGSSFPNGYNWYFDDLQNSSVNAIASWPGLDAGRIKNNGSATDDGWLGRMEIDTPRFFRLLRDGLQRSEALFTTLTGFSYYYVGLGNEIGYDSANGYPNSIPVSGQPFGQSGSGYEQSITSGGGSYGSGVKYVRSNAAANYWWEMPWLGELCPDAQYTTSWKVPATDDTATTAGPRKGNLPAGAAASEFRRVTRDQIGVNLPPGTTLESTERRTNAEGSTSMFNIGTASSTFHHQYRDGTSGALADGGTEVSRDLHFPLPPTAPISRPFDLNVGADGGIGDEFAYTTDYPHPTATLRRTYFAHSSGAKGSALVELSTAGLPHSAFVVVSGIDKTTESGSSFIARFAMLTLIHGFLSAGDPALPAPIGMPPRIVIKAPTAITELEDPTQIDLVWHTEWRRWDGIPYTTTFPPTYTRPESIVQYALLYSNDNGRTWRYMQNDAVATPGVLPPPALRVSDAADGVDEVFHWPVLRTRFPMGTYLIRVEAYRTAAMLHYSFHEERIYINR